VTWLVDRRCWRRKVVEGGVCWIYTGPPAHSQGKDLSNNAKRIASNVKHNSLSSLPYYVIYEGIYQGSFQHKFKRNGLTNYLEKPCMMIHILAYVLGILKSNTQTDQAVYLEVECIPPRPSTPKTNLTSLPPKAHSNPT
jgi:hypothetical protein